jgi:hypothetical protein
MKNTAEIIFRNDTRFLPFIINSVKTIATGLLAGLKSIVLFYIGYNVEYIIPINFAGFDIIVTVVIFGLLNGVLDALIISTKNTIAYKVFSFIIALVAAVYIYGYSLYIRLPDKLADSFVYGEGGGGLEPGGWFGFYFLSLIYFGASLLLSFPVTVLMLHSPAKGQKTGDKARKDT